MLAHLLTIRLQSQQKQEELYIHREEKLSEKGFFWDYLEYMEKAVARGSEAESKA